MFWKNEDEENDKIAKNLSRGIENLADRRTLFFFLIFCGVSNSIIWLCVFLFTLGLIPRQLAAALLALKGRQFFVLRKFVVVGALTD